MQLSEVEERFWDVALSAVNKRIQVYSQAQKLLPPRFDETPEAISQNVLGLLLIGQSTILMALRALMVRGESGDREIPAAFLDAFGEGE